MRAAGLVLFCLLTASAPLTIASTLDLTAYRGKVVYVDFWASWCGPCRQSFPWLDELVRRYGDKNLVVIGVNVDQDRAKADRFLDEVHADFPILYDPHGEIATLYKVTGMPSAVIIDRAGQLRFQHSGFSVKKRDEYEDQIQGLVNEPAAKPAH